MDSESKLKENAIIADIAEAMERLGYRITAIARTGSLIEISGRQVREAGAPDLAQEEDRPVEG